MLELHQLLLVHRGGGVWMVQLDLVLQLQDRDRHGPILGNVLFELGVGELDLP